MPIGRRLLMSSGGVVASYLQNVLDLTPIAYWPQNETSGTNADNAEGTAARDGTYTGVTLNSAASPITGDNAPLYDGANDYTTIRTTSLLAAFNRSEGTISAWAKVNASGDWSDGAFRMIIALHRDSSNTIYIRKTATTNQLEFTFEGVNQQNQILTTTLAGTTEWFNVIITWSVSNNRVRAYVNGSQVGGDQTSVTAYSGDPAANSGLIGAIFNTPIQVWSGYISHVAFFDSELTGANITTLATAV